MKTFLTVAGSDCSGGAGIQADLKTAAAYGLYGMSAVTALTAQNTLGVTAVRETDGDILEAQLQAVFTDIFPDTVKIGMIPSAESVMIIAEELRRFRPRFVVLDPVLSATAGTRFAGENTVGAMERELFSQVSLLTPNVPEAERILGDGREIGTHREAERAAWQLGERFETAVLVKGGHLLGGADDCLYLDGKIRWFYGGRVDAKGGHGTGCTLSSAIACGLALGLSTEEAVAGAKRYVTDALVHAPGLGHGNGPLNHCVAAQNGGKTEWR